MPRPSQDTLSSGFTLIELAIALMVIGLLIGGVLKGQELIENAKVTSFMRQVNAYDTATMIFRNTYGALPGDIRQPNRIPNCTAALCNTAGNGDGMIDGNPSEQEMLNAFPHLLKAGMIQGSTEGFTSLTPVTDTNAPLVYPDTPFGLNMSIHRTTYLDGPDHNSHVTPGFDSTETLSVSTKAIIQIDTKMDDGKPHTGDVQIMEYAERCPTPTDGTNAYDSTITARGCLLVVKTKF